MAQLSCPSPSSIPIPNVTPADLETFHASHFSTTSANYFSAHFLGLVPDDDETHREEDDDELGYYPDGIKRTLTDEQIAMFRHSEIQALLRERRHAEENKVIPPQEEFDNPEAEEGELADEPGVPAPEAEHSRPVTSTRISTGSKGNTKRHKAEQKKGGVYKQHAKPDLRKRTWDRVDRGLQSLDYGEVDAGAAAVPAASQRRRISYEDV